MDPSSKNLGLKWAIENRDKNKFIVNCCKNPIQTLQNLKNKDTNEINPYSEWYYSCAICKRKWKYETAGTTVNVVPLQ